LIGRNFVIPICPSNMVCCINEKHAKFFSENNYFYIMHRFCDVSSFLKTANKENWKFISISVGVGEKLDQMLKDFKEQNFKIDCITVDVAHGHHALVKEAINKIKKTFSDIFVIAGNVSTKEGTQDLKDWGADMVKVSIGTGKACITKDKTGFTLPIFTCIQECSEVDIPVMADGGIRSHGDIAKSIVAGATMNMAGSMFAACIDSPCETICDYPVCDSKSDRKFRTPKIYKKYFGSASFENKVLNNLKAENIEGKTVLLEENGKTYEELLLEIKQDIQSSISYSGGYNLSDLGRTQYRII
ncbi:GMP reductase, partial [bacterium]|nr:GMP reductase [bacterium]